VSYPVDDVNGPDAPPDSGDALVELGDAEAIELFLREEEARQALQDILSGEPDWSAQFLVA
jgi:hypothetical protein